jgi:hypothetical protein
MGNLLGCPAGLSSGQTNLLASHAQNQSNDSLQIGNFQQMNNLAELAGRWKVAISIYEDFR